ncbi:ENHANCED DISEASE RESISTANCE 2-like-like protein [Drosera capensis]
MASTPLLAEKSDGEGSSLSSSMPRRTKLEYFGWVYHLGTNKIGHEFCHLRFLFIRGKYVEMYKRDPHHNPGIRPIRRGVVGHTLMVEEAGRRKVNNGDLYVLRFYNRLDESRKGEIACGTAGETRKWIEAFDQAKQQAEYELSMGASASHKLTMEEELNLEGHRPRVRRYAYGLKKLIRIGEGPETLLRRSSGLIVDDRSDGRVESDSDAVEAHKWKCVCATNGIRIFEDVADSKGGKDVLVKSVGVINSSADTVFEVLLSLEPSKRYEWDMLTSELELIESLDGHYDVLYGKYDPKYFTWWNSKRDFVFSRQWFRGQDGTYSKQLVSFNWALLVTCCLSLHAKEEIKHLKGRNLMLGIDLLTRLNNKREEIPNLRGKTLERKKNLRLSTRSTGMRKITEVVGYKDYLWAHEITLIPLKSDGPKTKDLKPNDSKSSRETPRTKPHGRASLARLVPHIFAHAPLYANQYHISQHLRHLDMCCLQQFCIFQLYIRRSLRHLDIGVQRSFMMRGSCSLYGLFASTWEVKVLSPYGNAESPSCLLTHMLEIKSSSWCRWKKNRSSKFEKSIPFALLCQVAGLKEYISANPALTLKSPTTSIDSKTNGSVSNSDYEDMEVADEFYDAIAASMSDDDEDDEDSDVEIVVNKKDHKVKLKNVAWAIAGLSLKPSSAQDAHKNLDSATPSVPINLSEFHGSFRPGKDDTDTNCWTSPDGTGFMIRGKSYLKDSCKVRAGDPLLKLIAVDWIKSESSIDNIALRPFCIVQSEAGKKLPFVLVVNLQVPAKPNYNMVFYYAADKPINKSSLLGKFVDGTDAFRDSRFKLIPSIVKGYWMVKRAVGTKACLLGKAVTCRYLRQDNFLEIDVDIGSSSVARSVIGLVLGYVTSLVVDLAILLEAKEEEELPEYLLGTARLNCVKLESAVEV